MKTYDVVIAGAGIAGCLAARDLARQGHSVCILEKHRADELGHDWWDSVEACVFAETGLEEPAPGELKKPYNFKLLSAEGDTGAVAQMPPAIVNIDRKPLAQRLVAGAREAGVKIIERAHVTGPIIQGGAVAGAIAKTPSGTRAYPARITIDASGVDAPLRQNLPASWDFERRLPRQDFTIAYREIRENLDPAARTILLIGPHRGVQWISRDEGDLADVIAVVQDVPGRKNPRDLVKSLVAAEGGLGPLVRAGKIGRIPIRRSLDSFVAPGFIIAGDSACMTNPLNGSGVAASLRAASIAARAAHRALASGNTGAESLWPYNVQFKRTQDVKFAKLQMLQKLLFSESASNIHAFLAAGFIPHGKFWHPDEVLKPAAALGRGHKILTLLDRPGFLLRMAAVFALTGLLEQHYLNFPRKYDPAAFAAWRKRTGMLFDLVPSAPGGKF